MKSSKYKNMKQLLSLFVFILLLFSCSSNCPDQKKEIIHDTIIVTKTDTLIVRDTVYTSKHYDHVETLNIGGK